MSTGFASYPGRLDRQLMSRDWALPCFLEIHLDRIVVRKHEELES